MLYYSRKRVGSYNGPELLFKFRSCAASGEINFLKLLKNTTNVAFSKNRVSTITIYEKKIL